MKQKIQHLFLKKTKIYFLSCKCAYNIKMSFESIKNIVLLTTNPYTHKLWDSQLKYKKTSNIILTRDEQIHLLKLKQHGNLWGIAKFFRNKN